MALLGDVALLEEAEDTHLNPELESGGHTFQLGHTFCQKYFTVGVDFDVFLIKLHSV